MSHPVGGQFPLDDMTDDVQFSHSGSEEFIYERFVIDACRKFGNKTKLVFR
jgi:hypothetical protein